MKSKSQSTQKAKFIAAAKAAGCDESEAAFDNRLKKIATAKPEVEPAKKPKR